MKNCPTGIWFQLHRELQNWCSTDSSLDVKTFMKRHLHEGDSFLTITLPNFSADFERSLADGWINPTAFRGFRKVGTVPAFLSGFVRLVFDRKGQLLSDPNPDAIFAIRQLCLLYKKVELECTDERVEQAKAGYMQIEEELKTLDRTQDPEDLEELSKWFSLLFSNVLSRLNKKVDQFQLSPRHGKGSTADRKMGNEKFVMSSWPERAEHVFPYGEYVLPSWRYYHQFTPEFIPTRSELPVKVITVPKTQKSPRVIAVEPTCMQYMQQAVMTALVPLLEGDPICGPLIGFTDQTPNQRLAKIGSVSGELATLDLKEASDRVRYSVVRRLVRPWPSVLEALDASRTRTANVDGRIIRLSKFASMGSALCFPIEAMVFLAITCMGLSNSLRPGQRPSEVFLRSLAGQVRVYGDDIIVPTHGAADVCEFLESFGLKVNNSKSFYSGNFRESCGADYYGGHDVKPIRLTSVFPRSRRDADSIASTVEFRNQLYERGLWYSAAHVDEHLGRIHPLLVKPTPRNSGAVARFSFLPSGEERWNAKLHIHEIKRLRLRSTLPSIPLDGVFALRKCLSGEFSDPLYRDHLQRSGRSLAVNLTQAWVESS